MPIPPRQISQTNSLSLQEHWRAEAKWVAGLIGYQ